MTRINTNVSSYTAQKTLAQSNVQLQQALTRLSTGLRINSGKDDPAGLIAAEALRSDIVSTQKAISNGVRANQMIATADSALGQVSSLLQDIRSLIVEAANKGAMSPDQIAANQLQIDASLAALNRIAQTTTFQGKRLLDGSLDFIRTDVSGMSTVRDLQIDAANLGSTGRLAVNVDITSAATQAVITNTGFTPGSQAYATLTFAPGTTVTTTAGAEFDIISTSLTSGSGVTVQMVENDAQAGTVTYNGSNLMTIYYHSNGSTTAAQVVNYINNNLSQYFRAVLVTPNPVNGGASRTTAAASLTVRAAAAYAGANWNDVAVEVNVGNVGGTPIVTWDSTNRVINITIDDNETTTLAAVRTAVQNLSIDGVTPFSDSAISTPGHSRTRLYGGAGADIDAAANTGSTGGNTLYDDLVIQLAGRDGAQVFTFQAGATINSIVNAINGQTDSTGLVATMAVASGAATLSIRSSDYGSEAFAAVDIIREGVNGRFADLLSARRASGTDIVASVNGMLANGRGNTLSLNTALLSMTATVNDGSSTDFSFVITGGGAVFQLGPDVVSAQQSRIGIPSVNTAKLGGRHGRLYQLASGEAASLENDPTTAMRIVDEVLTKVNTLRGRLGAFQKTTVETNNKTLTDTVENLVSAESLIRDADFASETAALVRAQILVQSGTAVLSIANRNPEAVLALLR